MEQLHPDATILNRYVLYDAQLIPKENNYILFPQLGMVIQVGGTVGGHHGMCHNHLMAS